MANDWVLALVRKVARLGFVHCYWGGTENGNMLVPKVCYGTVLAILQKVARMGIILRNWVATAKGNMPVPKMCSGAVLESCFVLKKLF